MARYLRSRQAEWFVSPSPFAASLAADADRDLSTHLDGFMIYIYEKGNDWHEDPRPSCLAMIAIQRALRHDTIIRNRCLDAGYQGQVGRKCHEYASRCHGTTMSPMRCDKSPQLAVMTVQMMPTNYP